MTKSDQSLIQKLETLRYEDPVSPEAEAYNRGIYDCIQGIRQHQAEATYSENSIIPPKLDQQSQDVNDKNVVSKGENGGNEPNNTSTLIASLRGIHHEAQDSEFDTGFNKCLEMMRSVIDRHEKQLQNMKDDVLEAKTTSNTSNMISSTLNGRTKMDIPYAIPPTPKSGWICPKCGRVYSPEHPECKPCNDKVKPWPAQ